MEFEFIKKINIGVVNFKVGFPTLNIFFVNKYADWEFFYFNYVDVFMMLMLIGVLFKYFTCVE